MRRFVRRLYRFMPWIDPQIRFISLLPPNAKVLDIGCHKGHTIRKFREVRPDLKFFTVDILDRASYLPQDVDFQRFDCTERNWPFENETFDAITAVHLLEHLRHDGELFNQLKRVLKHGGTCYAEVPGLRRCFVPSFRFISEPPMPINFFDDPTHVTIYSMERLFRKFHDAGFRVYKVGIRRNGLMTLLSPLLVGASILLWRRDLLSWGVQNLLGLNIYSISNKDEDVS